MPTNSDDKITIIANQTVSGLNGADEFYYTSGNATIHGGDLNERYDSNVYGEKTGGDRLYFKTSPVSLTFSTSEDGVATSSKGRLTFTGIERIHLGDGNDTVNAASATLESAHGGTPVHGLTLYAGGGNDSIIGSRGGDFIDGGSGNDTIRAGAGDDFVQSSTGNDLIFGGAGTDNIRWGQGNFDEVVGNDTIYGGAGSDVINIWIKAGWENSAGVATNITSIAADGSTAGNAATNIGGARSTLTYSQFETVWTHEGRDTMTGANATISSTGTGFHGNTRWGDDVLIGSRGNDTLEGGEGRDTITGGAGNDLISANGEFYNSYAPGDGDRDTLIFRGAFGKDTVLGFDAGVDVIDLGGASYRETVTSQGTLITVGTNTILLAHVFDW
ncbi:MAG: calcium-binding protein [Paracoccus sp. (in: a-proteobacteria)]|uniref:calcium-binding protein n=1 Tax=Paracoccus sp. TaxID=267 RepID=UPI0039E58054